MKNSEIKNIYFRNNGASALYCGSALIWKKGSEEIDPDNYIPKYNFSGKFTDDSTEEDWWYYANNSTLDKISIVDKVNPETKIFDFDRTLIPKDNFGTAFLFYNNKKIEEIYMYRPTILTSIIQMFSSCSSLKSVKFDFSDTTSLTNVQYLFSSCSELENVDFGVMNFINVENTYNFFNNNYNIQNIKGEIHNIKANIDLGNYNIYNSTLSWGHKLTNDSAMVFINGLSEDIEDTRAITFHRDCYDTLTEEQIALATAKGWSIVRS